MTVGFLHPGAMGSSLAAACRVPTLWASDGRSAATKTRAEAVGMTDVGTVTELAARADVIVSICPPVAAVDTAREVAAAGFEGIYVDANAVSPETANEIAGIVATYVDGGVIGPPVSGPDSTRLYLSGTAAADVAPNWDASDLHVIVLGEAPTAASALKVTYAAWTKGSAALLLSVRALAAFHDVDDALVAEWARSIPGLAERSERAAKGVAPKAWRFTSEMHEIATTFAAADLPDGFHAAAGEIYRRMSGLREHEHAAVPDVVAALMDLP